MGTNDGRNGETRSLGGPSNGGSNAAVGRARTAGQAARRLIDRHPRRVLITMASALIPLGTSCSLSLANETPEVLQFCYAADGDSPQGAAEAAPSEPCLPAAASCPRTRSAGLAVTPSPNCEP